MRPGSRLVLVVEDDPALLAAMKRHLGNVGFDVFTAYDYRTALAQLQATLPDVACIDLCLPDESGYELCERIRQQAVLCFVPIAVTSERAFPEDMARAEEAGANAFLKKPFSMQLLAETLEMLAAGKAESRPPMRRLRWG
jgi:DNA-binding response OmpR family regulator